MCLGLVRDKTTNLCLDVPLWSVPSAAPWVLWRTVRHYWAALVTAGLLYYTRQQCILDNEEVATYRTHVTRFGSVRGN